MVFQVRQLEGCSLAGFSVPEFGCGFSAPGEGLPSLLYWFQRQWGRGALRTLGNPVLNMLAKGAFVESARLLGLCISHLPWEAAIQDKLPSFFPK